MAGVYDWLQNQPVDPKVPAWDGTGEAIGLESYVRVANAYELTLEQDKRLLAGPRLWQNLRGEALRAVETMNVAELRVPDGVGVLMRALAARYPETPLKKLPRLYRALFREIRYQRGTDAGDIFTKFERARAELEIADVDTQVSEGIMGFFALECLGLSDAEQNHVLTLTGLNLEYRRIKAVILEMYPRGSLEKPKHAEHSAHTGRKGWRQDGWNRTSHHMSYAAEAEEPEQYDDDYYNYDEESYDEYGYLANNHYEDDYEATEAEAWVTEQSANLDEATAYVESLAMNDEKIEGEETEPSQEKQDEVIQGYAWIAEAHIGLKEAKAHMNTIAKARGFYGKEGETPSSSTSGGKSSGKSIEQRKVHTRCLDCGRLGHWRGDTQCPRKGQGKGTKGKGKSKSKKGYSGKGYGKRKGKKGLFAWALASIAMLFGFHADMSTLPEQPVTPARTAATAYFVYDFEHYDAMMAVEQTVMAIVDSGCSNSVAGLDWLKRVEGSVQRRGLFVRKVVTKEVFHGLGGAVRQATERWEIPCGIYQRPAVISFAAIPGSMPGLVSKAELEALGFVWDASRKKCDFKTLDVSEVSLPENDAGCMMLDITNYGPDTTKAELFIEFRENISYVVEKVTHDNEYTEPKITEAEQRRDLLQQAYTAAGDALRDGDAGRALPKPVRRQIVETVSELQSAYASFYDHGKTFVWELFAGKHLMTRVSVMGGHIAGQPLELELGVDLADPEVRAAIIRAVEIYKPWVVAGGFPCSPWSALQNLTIAAGFIDRVNEKRKQHFPFLTLMRDLLIIQKRGGRVGIAENPWSSRAWAQEPLQILIHDHGYELVRGDQCRWDLRSWTGGLHRKSTGFLVPENSSLTEHLQKWCTRDHPHDHVIGGAKVTAAAAHWPLQLCQTMVAGAVEDLARMSRVLPGLTRALHRGGMLSYDTVIGKLVDELYLRSGCCAATTLEPNTNIKVNAGEFVRRIILGYDDSDELIYFNDDWDTPNDPKINTDDIDVQDTDVFLVIGIYEAERSYELSYPATRKLDEMLGGAAQPPRKRTKALPQQLPALRAPPRDAAEAGARLRERMWEDPPRCEPGAVADLPEDDGDAHRVLPDGRLQHTGYNNKPHNITAGQWSALTRLHDGLAHPSNSSLVRMLRRWKAKPEVLEAAANMRCSVCAEIQRKAPSRRAKEPQVTAFNERVAYDEFECLLTDGTTAYLLMIMDEASNYRVVVPMLSGKKIPSAKEIIEALHIGWISWAGSPEALRFDPLKAHMAEATRLFFLEQGLEEMPGAAEAHNWTGKLDKNIDFFKDHFMRVSNAASLTSEDNPWQWTSKITAAQNKHLRVAGFSPNHFVFGRDPRAPTSLLSDEGKFLAQASSRVPGSGARRAEQLRMAAQRAIIEMDDVQAVTRTLAHRHVRSPKVWRPGDLCYYWREPSIRATSRRLQQAACWRGPAVVLGTQGTSRIYVGTWGTIVLCQPEQLRDASDDEIAGYNNLNELVAIIGEDLKTHTQLGYVDERNKGPRTTTTTTTTASSQEPASSSAGQRITMMPLPEETAGPATAPAGPVEEPPQCSSEPPRSSSAASEHAQRSFEHPAPERPKRTMGDVMNEIEEQAKKHARPNTEEPVPTQATGATTRDEEPVIPTHRITGKRSADAIAAEQAIAHIETKRARQALQARIAFLSSRIDYVDPKVYKRKEKGREIARHRLPQGTEEHYEKAMAEEWKKHIDHDMFDIQWDESAADLKKAGKNVLSMRYVLTDKNENERGAKTLKEVPVKARARLVTPGYADLDNLKGKLRKDAPTLPREAMSMLLQTAASKSWKIQQGDVASAFLSGGYFEREVYVVAPRGGLPAVGNTPFVPEGTVMKLKKSMPGLADAPLEWHHVHRQGILDIGMVESSVCKALYLYYEDGELHGILGTHVDDDLMAGSEKFDKVIAELRKRFHFDKWHEGTFVHLGCLIEQRPDFGITVAQKQYADGMSKIDVTADRRRMVDAAATSDEVTALRAGCGKVAWLVRNTRPDLAFELAYIMQNITTAKVATVLRFNELVRNAKQGAHQKVIFEPIPLDEINVIGWCDASFANVDDGTVDDGVTLASQAGYVIGYASNEAVENGKGLVSIAEWLTHRLKRKVRSTLAAETMSANECLEAMDIHRAHLAELRSDGPLDRYQWRELVKVVRCTLVTDSKSLYDFTNRRGSTPSEKRLRIDMEIIRDQINDGDLEIRWVNTHQQLADALTKGSPDAFIYLKLVMKTREFAIVDDPRLEEVMQEHRELRQRHRSEAKQKRDAVALHAASALVDALAAQDEGDPSGDHLLSSGGLGGVLAALSAAYYAKQLEKTRQTVPKATAMAATTTAATTAATSSSTTSTAGKSPCARCNMFGHDKEACTGKRVPMPHPRTSSSAHWCDRADPDTCAHPAHAISKHGTNQYGLRLVCCACDKVIRSNKLHA